MLKWLFGKENVEKEKESKEVPVPNKVDIETFLEHHTERLEDGGRILLSQLWEEHKTKIKRRQEEGTRAESIDTFLEENEVYSYYEKAVVFLERILNREFHLLEGEWFYHTEGDIKYSLNVTEYGIHYTVEKKHSRSIGNEIIRLIYSYNKKKVMEFRSCVIEPKKRQFIQCDIKTSTIFRKIQNRLIDIQETYQAHGIIELRVSSYDVLKKESLRELISKEKVR